MSNIVKHPVSVENNDGEFLQALQEFRDMVSRKVDGGCLVSELYSAFVRDLHIDRNLEAFRRAARFTELETIDNGVWKFTVTSNFAEYEGDFIRIERIIPSAEDKTLEYSRAADLHFSLSLQEMFSSPDLMSGPTSFLVQPMVSILLTRKPRVIIKSTRDTFLEAVFKEDDQHHVKVTIGGWFETRLGLPESIH